MVNLEDTNKMSETFGKVFKFVLFKALDLLNYLKGWLRNRSFVKKLLYERWSEKTFNNYGIHEIMLSDKVRVDNYYKAIMKYVKEGDIVVDVGTGTGILSFFASQRNPKRIYAIDHSNVIETAKSLAKYNNIKNVEFVNVSSKNFQIPEKVDIILHEQIGYYLFDEHIVENLTDLRDRLLAKNGKIIPNRFEVFIEPMCLKEEYRMPFIWEINSHNIKYDNLKELNEDRISYESKECLPGYYTRELYPFEVDYLLCEPVKIMELDLETVNEKDIPKRLHYRKTISKNGQMDLIGIYFKAIFDDEIFFDNSPLSTRTSFHMRAIRTEARQYKEGDVLEFNWDIRDIADIYTWTFTYQKIQTLEQ